MENVNDLHALGWDARFGRAHEELAGQGLVLGRVFRHDRDRYRVVTAVGELTAQIAGAFRHFAESPADFPAVGDWVGLSPAANPADVAVIHALVPRQTHISRTVAGGRTDEQVIAANVDILFLVSDLAFDFNVRRLERYLVLATESGIQPVILLTKADLVTDNQRPAQMVERVALDVPVHVVSAKTGAGMAAVRAHLSPGKTVAVIGSSGVGKSTLINALLGNGELRTGDIRHSDGRGTHTTTWREIIRMPTGALLVDTPGMRELQLWADSPGDIGGFDDIEALAEQCRFRNCLHDGEPGCAIEAAIEADELDRGRVENWHKLQRELDHLARKQDQRERQNAKARWKSMSKAMRQQHKFNERDGR